MMTDKDLLVKKIINIVEEAEAKMEEELESKYAGEDDGTKYAILDSIQSLAFVEIKNEVRRYKMMSNIKIIK